MRDAIRWVLAIGVVLCVSFIGAACAGESGSREGESGESAMASDTGDHESPEGGMEAGGGEGAGGEHDEGGERGDGERGEHDGEEGEGHDEGGGEGEEGGEYIAIGVAWDAMRNGARLTLAYDPGYDVFQGRVQNTTEATLCRVRVEVHLADGPELGPTEPKDVPAGGSIAVELPVNGTTFESWTAHPEISRCSG